MWQGQTHVSNSIVIIVIVLSNFFEFLSFNIKQNQTHSILKGLYQNLWRSLDTRRWKNSKSHVFESLLLTAKNQDVFAVLPTGFVESLIYQVLPALFSELYRLRHGTIKNFVIAVVIPLEIVYPRPASWDLEKAWYSSRLFRSLV
jgi:hypothetical protein